MALNWRKTAYPAGPGDDGGVTDADHSLKQPPNVTIPLPSESNTHNDGNSGTSAPQSAVSSHKTGQEISPYGHKIPQFTMKQRLQQSKPSFKPFQPIDNNTTSSSSRRQKKNRDSTNNLPLALPVQQEKPRTLCQNIAWRLKKNRDTMNNFSSALPVQQEKKPRTPSQQIAHGLDIFRDTSKRSRKAKEKSSQPQQHSPSSKSPETKKQRSDNPQQTGQNMTDRTTNTVTQSTEKGTARKHDFHSGVGSPVSSNTLDKENFKKLRADDTPPSVKELHDAGCKGCKEKSEEIPEMTKDAVDGPKRALFADLARQATNTAKVPAASDETNRSEPTTKTTKQDGGCDTSKALTNVSNGNKSISNEGVGEQKGIKIATATAGESGETENTTLHSPGKKADEGMKTAAATAVKNGKILPKKADDDQPCGTNNRGIDMKRSHVETNTEEDDATGDRGIQSLTRVNGDDDDDDDDRPEFMLPIESSASGTGRTESSASTAEERVSVPVLPVGTSGKPVVALVVAPQSVNGTATQPVVPSLVAAAATENSAAMGTLPVPPVAGATRTAASSPLITKKTTDEGGGYEQNEKVAGKLKKAVVPSASNRLIPALSLRKDSSKTSNHIGHVNDDGYSDDDVFEEGGGGNEVGEEEDDQMFDVDQGDVTSNLCSSDNSSEDLTDKTHQQKNGSNPPVADNLEDNKKNDAAKETVVAEQRKRNREDSDNDNKDTAVEASSEAGRKPNNDPPSSHQEVENTNTHVPDDTTEGTQLRAAFPALTSTGASTATVETVESTNEHVEASPENNTTEASQELNVQVHLACIFFDVTGLLPKFRPFKVDNIQNHQRNDMAQLVLLLGNYARKIQHFPNDTSILRAISNQFHHFSVNDYYGVITRTVAAIKSTSYIERVTEKAAIEKTLDKHPYFKMVNHLLVVDNFEDFQKEPWEETVTMAIYAANQSESNILVKTWGFNVVRKKIKNSIDTKQFILIAAIIRKKDKKSAFYVTKTKGVGSRVEDYRVIGTDGTDKIVHFNHLHNYYRNCSICLMQYRSDTNHTRILADDYGGSKEILTSTNTSVSAVDTIPVAVLATGGDGGTVPVATKGERSCVTDVVELFLYSKFLEGEFTFNPDAVDVYNRSRGITTEDAPAKFPFGMLGEGAVTSDMPTSKKPKPPGGKSKKPKPPEENIHYKRIQIFFRTNGMVSSSDKVLVLRKEDVKRFKLKQQKYLNYRDRELWNLTKGIFLVLLKWGEKDKPFPDANRHAVLFDAERSWVADRDGGFEMKIDEDTVEDREGGFEMNIDEGNVEEDKYEKQATDVLKSFWPEGKSLRFEIANVFEFLQKES